MTTILLLTFGKDGYHFATHNMVRSIRHYTPDQHITVATDRPAFDYGGDVEIYHLQSSDILNYSGRIDPAKVKVSMDMFTTHDFLYLDVDGIVLKDIRPLITACEKQPKPYITDVQGSGSKGDRINYDIWADHDDVWPFFTLPEDGTFHAIQSSWCYVRRGDVSASLFGIARIFHELEFPLSKLKMRWGNTMPDELLFSAACCFLGVDPTNGINRPIFFGQRNYEGNWENDFYILSIYGNQGHNGKGGLVLPRYLKAYDAVGRRVGATYLQKYIMRDKHAN